MEEVHGGAFSTHVNGHALARKILRAGYYWSNMESDYCQHVKRCMKCQMYANNIHMAPSTLHNLTSPWLFSMWGLDMIGPIKPKACNGHRFILVAIDYFTKWVEAASYANVTKSVVTKHHMPLRLPAHIIIDNGTNLNNKMMTKLCEQFKIKHHNSTPYRPKMNRAVEAVNKNIKKIIQKMVVTYKD
ncbi:Gypsy retrotransposon integrase-like protein 1, partial [Mucuna pruriens]